MSEAYDYEESEDSMLVNPFFQGGEILKEKPSIDDYLGKWMPLRDWLSVEFPKEIVSMIMDYNYNCSTMYLKEGKINGKYIEGSKRIVMLKHCQDNEIFYDINDNENFTLIIKNGTFRLRSRTENGNRVLSLCEKNQ